MSDSYYKTLIHNLSTAQDKLKIKLEIGSDFSSEFPKGTSQSKGRH